MRISDIIRASETQYQPRFTYWLNFICHVEATLDADGSIRVEDDNDGAGLTFCGTTQRDDGFVPGSVTPNWVAKTYHDKYWAPSQAVNLPWGVGEETANIAVNEGLGTAGKLLQQTLSDLGARIGIDGKIGPATEQAAAAFDADSVLHALVAHNDAHYLAICKIHPENLRFLRGWLNRDAEALKAFEAEAIAQKLA
jgi:lysozyme family protein